VRRRRAIIYDDEPSVLELLEKVLTRRDYEVISLTEPYICPIYENNGSHCLKEHPPCADVIIADHRMPLMTGIELLRTQAENGCRLTCENKAIITGHLDEQELQCVKDLGCFYLAKPFHISDFLIWIEQCEKRIDLATPIGIRRKEKRTPARRDITYQTDTHGSMTGVLTDFSPSGFCLKAKHHFDELQTIRVVSGPQEIGTVAAARWSRGTEDGHYLSGFACC
jgi:CheY-like chemotaxis protein